MKIVYLVSKGSYSDYTVLGVYSTKEKAEEIIEFLTDTYNDCDIEERYLDLTPQEGEQVSIYLKLSDGEVLRKDFFNLVWIAQWDFPKKGCITQLYDPPPIDEYVDVMYYFSDTLERAVKAGNEKRIQFLASGLTQKDWNSIL